MKLSMLLHLREVRTKKLCSVLTVYHSTEAAVAPSNVTANGSSSTVILVEWEGLTQCRLVNGHIVGYRVQYGVQQSGGLVLTKEVTGNWSSGGETDLTGLTPSTNYSIAVAAVNEEGTVGLYSDPVIVERDSSDTTSVPTVVDTSASPKTFCDKTNSLWCIIVPATSVVLLVMVSGTLPFVIYYLR